MLQEVTTYGTQEKELVPLLLCFSVSPLEPVKFVFLIQKKPFNKKKKIEK